MKAKSIEMWNNSWQEAHHKLYDIKDNVAHWVVVKDLSRYQEVTLNRLRSGHTYLTHVYFLDNTIPDVPPVCLYCIEAVITVKHLSIRCTCLVNIRRSLFPNYNRDERGLQRILGENGDSRKIFLFLKRLKINRSI